mgnify:CR=1 FL=1
MSSGKCIYCGKDAWNELNTLAIDMSNDRIHEWCYAKRKEKRSSAIAKSVIAGDVISA